MARLAPGHQQVILLRYFDGLEPVELATALGCSRQTLAVKVHRALRALRLELDRGAIDAA
jgi:RNA polymerase sigma-70 factor (ECF subfamily)